MFNVVIGLVGGWSIYKGEPDFALIRVFCILSSYWIADYLAEWFFAERLRAMVALVCLFVFATNVGVAALQRANEFLTGRSNAAAEVEVIFKSPIRSDALQLIAANSAYVFMLEKDRRTVLVVPKDRVDFIRVKKSD